MNNWIEVECGDKRLRIRKERSIFAQGMISKIFARDGAIGTHEVIKVDCEILSQEKDWREITDFDLKNIDSESAKELYEKIVELRKIDLDFQEDPSPKKK